MNQMSWVNYTIGEDQLASWLLAYPEPMYVSLRGSALFRELGDDSDLSTLLELPSLRSVNLAGLIVREDPDFVPYTEDEQYDYRKQMERWSDMNDGIRMPLIQKLLLNREYASTFDMHPDGSVTAGGGCILVHIPEVCSWELSPEVRILGNYLCSGYAGLCSFTFHDEVEHIGSFAFASCEGERHQSTFPQLILPRGLKSLGAYAFLSADCEEVVLPEGLEVLPRYCFSGSYFKACPKFLSSLKCLEECSLSPIDTFRPEIVLPEGIEEVWWETFFSIHKTHLPASLKHIDEDFYTDATPCTCRAEYPPYVEVAPENPYYYAEGGTLYHHMDREYCSRDGWICPCVKRECALRGSYNGVHPDG